MLVGEENTDVLHRQDVAAFVNSYPTLDVTQKLVGSDYTAGASIELEVTLSRDADEDMEEDVDADQSVVAPFYPTQKMANWWIVVGEPATKQLLVIKRVTVNKRELSAKLEFTLPKGQHELKLYVICDSYIGADHDIALGTVEVAEGEDSDSDEDSDEDMEE